MNKLLRKSILLFSLGLLFSSLNSFTTDKDGKIMYINSKVNAANDSKDILEVIKGEKDKR